VERFRIVLLGETGAGKTSLFLRATQDVWTEVSVLVRDLFLTSMTGVGPGHGS
jgi:GTPase SAR1 family protein